MRIVKRLTFYKEASLFYVRIEITSYSYSHTGWNRGYAYNEEAGSPSGEACPK
jgi:hypothetical protein